MRTQAQFEENEEFRSEISYDPRKARQFPTTIIGRARLRNMRMFLYQIDVPFPIPMNSAYVTSEYCKKYGEDEGDLTGKGLL